MEIIQIFSGIAVALFISWVIWVSYTLVENKKSIAVAQESAKGVSAELTSIVKNLTDMRTDITDGFKEFKTEVRADITQMSNTLSVFTRTENDVLKELLSARK